MLSKFFTANPSNIQQIIENGYIVFSSYINLSNRYVLFITWDVSRTHTKIKLFNKNNLKECIKEQEFVGEYCFAGLIPPDFFLLLKKDSNEFFKFRVDNLEVQSSFECSTYNGMHPHPINERYFFTINEINSRSKGGPFELQFYPMETTSASFNAASAPWL